MFDSESSQEIGTRSVEREAIITSSFRVASSLSDIVFLDNPDAPWAGYLAGTLSGGGFDIYSVEGQRVFSASGPSLNGFVGVSGFNLRGEQFPFLFGIDSDGVLRSFAVVEQAEDVVELPLELDFEGEWRSACLYDAGIGYADLALLGAGSEAVVVRVRDAGGAGLAVELRAQVNLPFPARDCVRADEDLIVAGPTSGIARIGLDSEIMAETSALSISDIAYSELFGRPVVMTLEPGTSAFQVYDAQTLQVIAALGTTGGLSTDGFQRPTAIASTLASYGGMAFSTGLIAGYDREDDSVKLLARDVVSRAVLAPAETTG